ncbi:MAG TPA: hypothetical protein VGJ60_08340 [Chloroflexota bacterium]|jgi:hypothetical protein
MKVRWSAVVSLLGVAIIVGLWVTHCSGPQAQVVGTPSLRAPAQPGQPYRIEAVVANPGPGQGQVQVTFRLRDLATGLAYQSQEQADLEPGEQVRVVTDIAAPDGNYQPEVEVRYPPR